MSSERDERDDADVRQSADSFWRAGTAVSDGVREFYEASHAWVERRHLLVQLTVGSAVWLVGNWIYNRIAPPILAVITASAERVPSEIEAESLMLFLRGNPIFASVQLLLLLLVIVVTQNQRQTRTHNTAESKLTTVPAEPIEATDGGTPERHVPSDWTICGVICGVIVGISFGPGGILAGIYLGFWLGTKLDYRAYERNPHTPDPSAESKAER